MYRLVEMDDVFVATQVESLLIPENVETLGLFKDTLNHLFKLKYFMTETSVSLSRSFVKSIQQKSLQTLLTKIVATSPVIVTICLNNCLY